MQLSIHEPLVEVFEERSNAYLLQTIPLDPALNPYRNAVDYVDKKLRP